MIGIRWIDFDHIPDRLSGLIDLSYNLWSSWHPEAWLLFKNLNRQGWKESIHNPVRMLQELPPELLEAAASNIDYTNHYDAVIAKFQRYMLAKNQWFDEYYPEHQHHKIAYFSAEYGLQHSLPLYAGGLGFLAGDHLKECSDIGIPLVAVGFMYSDGYLHQRIRNDGWQEDVEEKLDRDNAPVKRVLGRDGNQLILQVPFIAPQIHFALWRVDIGRVILYLIDTEIEQNPPHLRNISSRLYSSINEMRLLQEIVLGIGGTHALKSLGVKYSAVHLNEGHAAFALVELYRQKIEEGLTPEEAFHHVYNTTLFTTHTPVPAGHDKFPHWMIDKYFNAYYSGIHMSREDFLKKGLHFEDPPDTFNMAAFCMRMAAHANGVSEKHGEVARRMWHFLWPEHKLDEVPIGSVTNGVHIPTWINPRLVTLINRYISPICPDWFEHHDKEYVWALIDRVPDAKLWELHYALKIKLINRILQFKRRDWMKYQADCANVVAGGALIDPNTLTIGFARRFSTYKRADLIFQDLDRLKKILNNPWKPVQIIFAGKAHPADDEGKRILQRIYQYAQQPEFGGRIAFVEDYGEQVAKYLVQGVDVWMNNPVPPLEASGTSGMKAAVNGVLNFSIADGWWIEGYNGKNGWIFGKSHTNNDRNWEDASEMYSLLENEIVPLYYDTDLDGIPHKWVAMMKESIKSNAPRFSSRRMVKEYMHKYYISILSCAECNAFVDDSTPEGISQ